MLPTIWWRRVNKSKMKKIVDFQDIDISKVKFNHNVPVTFNFHGIAIASATVTKIDHEIYAEFPTPMILNPPNDRFFKLAPCIRVLKKEGDVITESELISIGIVPKY